MAKPSVIGKDRLGRDIRDYAHGEWFSVPRGVIHWGPAVNYDKCVGCGLCYVTCGGRVVYDWDVIKSRPVVARFDNCSPGCNTCANLCPADALTFPEIADIRAQRDQHHVVAKARKKVAALQDKAGESG